MYNVYLYSFSLNKNIQRTFLRGNDYCRRKIAYVTPDDLHPCINIAFSHINDLGGTVRMSWFQGYFLQVMFSTLMATFGKCSAKNTIIPKKS